MKVKTAIETETAAKVVPEEKRVPQWVMPAVKAAVIAADAVLAAACFMAAFSFREGSAILSPTAWAWSKEFVPYAGILYFLITVRVGMLLYQRVYRYQGAFSYAQEAIKIFKAILVSSLLTVAWAFLFRGGFAFREFSYSRAIFLLDFAIALVVFGAFHLSLRFLQARVRERDINLIPTLIVGTNADAEQTASLLRERPDLGYRVVGHVSTDEAASNTIADVDILGDLSSLARLIRELGIQEVIITDNKLPSDLLFEAMMQIGRKQRVEFRFAPTLFNVLPQKTSVEQIGVLPMVRLFREPLSEADRFIKRVSDIVIAAVALVLVSPLWLLIAVLIRFDSRGAAVFRQERVGMDGRIFLCFKFRTMHAGSDEEAHRDVSRKHIEGHPEANAGDEERPVFGKVKDDTRVTKAGRWLRRSSLDELPQLLNVLKGDMSVVGPRPPIAYEVKEYDMWHRKRLDMKPGITGLWQVSGRNRLRFDDMVRIDLFYIENWSIWLDLKIILLTIPAIFRGDGAR